MVGTAAEKDDSPTWEDFESIDELIRYTEYADICWISYRYLESIAEQGKRIPRRQDLPPEAVYDWKRLRFAVHFCGDNGGGGLFYAIVVSHAWWSRDHPDPEGRQVRTLVEHIKRMKALEMWESKSKYARFIENVDIPVFWDFASLYQRPRNASQDDAFQRALGGMHLLYSHELNRVVQLEGVPHDAPNPIPYRDRGWPTLEQAISRVKPIKGTQASITSGVDRIGLDGAPATNSPITGGLGFLLSCNRFDKVLEKTKFFSVRADIQIVKQIYKTVAHVLFAGVKTMRLPNLTDDSAVEDFLELLPMYTNLEHLMFDEASISTAGLAAIVDLLLEEKQTNTNNGPPLPHQKFRNLPKLTNMACHNCHIDQEGRDHLWRLYRLRPQLFISVSVSTKHVETRPLDWSIVKQNRREKIEKEIIEMQKVPPDYPMRAATMRGHVVQYRIIELLEEMNCEGQHPRPRSEEYDDLPTEAIAMMEKLEMPKLLPSARIKDDGSYCDEKLVEQFLDTVERELLVNQKLLENHYAYVHTAPVSITDIRVLVRIETELLQSQKMLELQKKGYMRILREPQQEV